jgi:hypothetical protein
MKKKRHVCAYCGGKKYAKYMQRGPTFLTPNKLVWYCGNPLKCKKRVANYKK